jgi:hypothetical protein
MEHGFHGFARIFIGFSGGLFASERPGQMPGLSDKHGFSRKQNNNQKSKKSVEIRANPCSIFGLP